MNEKEEKIRTNIIITKFLKVINVYNNRIVEYII